MIVSVSRQANDTVDLAPSARGILHAPAMNSRAGNWGASRERAPTPASSKTTTARSSSALSPSGSTPVGGIRFQQTEQQPRGGAAWHHRNAQPLRVVRAEAAASASAELSRRSLSPRAPPPSHWSPSRASRALCLWQSSASSMPRGSKSSRNRSPNTSSCGAGSTRSSLRFRPRRRQKAFTPTRRVSRSCSPPSGSAPKRATCSKNDRTHGAKTCWDTGSLPYSHRPWRL